MKVLAITLIVIIGFLSFSNAELTPNFPGNQPLVIDGSTPVTSNTTTNVTTEPKTVLDNFDVFQQPLVIELRAPAPPTVTATQFAQSSSILGGERDLILTALTGTTGRVFSASISDSQFSIATPNGANGEAQLQYDGVDGSATLDTSPGLGGVDLTFGNAKGFQISATTDLTTQYKITVVSGDGGSGTVTNSVPGSEGTVFFQYQIPFSSFTGVDFANVVAIQLTVDALDNVDFIMESFVTYGDANVISEGGSHVEGSVLPCTADYYNVKTLTGLSPGNYIRISFNQSGEASHPTDLGSFYIVASTYDDLESELSSNVNIIDTLGQLPGPHNYLYACEEVSSCEIEITCQLEETTYYIAISGGQQGVVNYEFDILLRQAEVFELFDCVSQPVIDDRRSTQPPDDRTLYYRFFAIDIPKANYGEGSYLVVNVSRAEPFPIEFRLSYDGLPGSYENTGRWDIEDFDSDGNLVDDCTFEYCVDTTDSAYTHPVNSDPRIPCIATTATEYLFPGGPYQLTAKLTVDPCAFQYGVWYAAILLPPRVNVTDPLDISGNENYTITACVITPTVTELERNITFKGYVEPEQQTHYKIVIPDESVVPGETHLFIQVSNIRNGFVDIWVHQDVGGIQNLAGGPEGCLPANATCNTCDACNIVIEKCHFTPGTWYISLSISSYVDMDRLPITYTIRADWMVDSAPITLYSGIPVSRAIGASLYDFFVIDIPPTVDTWLFIELFTKACDTEVIISVLHGSLPGGECYARPDFYCLTGDPRDITYTTPQFGQQVTQIPKQRESCTFMIQTCELEAGPLYISVYGQRTNYAAYGDTTYYQIPAHYTLFVDFEVAKSLHSGVSLTETIYQNQYKHYYIRADQILEGSYMSVEITNIQHGVPQTLELFVNYNYLAGDCPCYEHLYNATGAQLPGCNGVVPSNEPNFIPQPNTVATCATIIVPACDFRPGVWYVSVKGINQDLVQYTTPIGYTLTVTIHDAPVFHPLILGRSTPGSVVQWNKTLEYTNYKLGASPLPLTDLVFKLTYVQNCEYQAKHDNLRDRLVMFVNADGPAGDKCWDRRCVANIQSESYCTVVIPNCQWQSNDYFVAIKGDYDADFPGRFTVRASLEEVRFYQLSSGVSVYDRVSQSLYKHYYIISTGAIGKYLAVDFYTNNDQDLVSVYLNVQEPAGASPCYSNINSCIKKNSCAFQVETCDIEAGRYYISVYGEPHQFYDISTEYTLTASMRPLTTALGDGNPLTGSVRAGGVVHYKIEVDVVSDGDFLTFEIDNVQHGSVVVYYQFESVAGRCPCYLYEYSCYADSANTEWCEIRVPSCEFSAGIHYFSVVGLKNKSPSALACSTAIGYTIEANVVKPNIIEPTVVVGRFTEYTELFQFVANGRYNHYQFDFTQEDYDAGYHVIVEITSVRDGALFVYFTPDFPGDEATDCHLAKLCTSGLGSGKSCYWQVPFSLTKPRYDKANNEYSTLFITVEGRTGRLQASYNILIYKQPVPEIIANPAFTLDNVTSSLNFPVGAEVNITHFKVDEPNGWTQFIKLANVSGHTDPLRGEMLEIFIYRIINNFLEPMSFNVYLFPERPAGAHECCDSLDSNLGSCQGAPTLTTVQLTTQVYDDTEYFSYTANLPTGVGNGPTNEPFFGQNLTVRVWPCEYTRYCANVSDWWLAIVPIAATDPSSTPLPGLSYSVQYRTRNIRLDEVYQVGSIDLTQYVNTYQYTPDYLVRSFSTEDEGWLSFILDFSSAPFSGRLSIQPVIVNGTSVVYINPNGFAAPPVDSFQDETYDKEECSQYCYTNVFYNSADCDLSGRFVATTCNLQSTYFITVRNIGGPNTFSAVRFRIVAIYDTEPVIAPMHTTELSPFIATSGNSVFNIPGLEGEDYDFYTFPIDDGDIADFQSLIVDLNRNVASIPLNDTGVLEVFVRLGSKAGDFTETCYSWDYSCTNIGARERCIMQIPSKQLTQGFWSVSVYNPNFDYTIPADLPQYQLSIYLQAPPTDLTIGIPFVQANSTLSYLLPGTFKFFRFTVTEADLSFTSEEINGSYYTKYIRVAAQGINTTVSDFYIYGNYDTLAGDDLNGYAFSLEFTQSSSCDEPGFNCYYDYVPCSDYSQLLTGTYYIGLYLNGPTTYNLTVSLETYNFTVLAPVSTAGSGKRAALTDYVWSVTPTNLDISTARHSNYYYALNTADSGVTDLTNYYFLVNISVPVTNSSSLQTAYVRVWRDDCAEFSAFTTSGSYHVIDALTLSPCSATGGRYYFLVYAPNDTPFTLSFTQVSLFTQTLLNNQIFVDEIYPYEYDEYFYPSAADVHQGATLSVRVCALCGEVEAWIREDTPAGPIDNTSQYASCALDYCTASASAGALFDDEGDNCCVMFLDTCQYEQRGYYIAVRGVGTEFPNSVNQHILLPALYQLQATQTNIQVHDIPLCGTTVEYKQPVSQVPQQYAVDIESLNLGAQIRFTMLVPTEYVSSVEGSASILTINRNVEVGYTSYCYNLPYTCSVFSNSGTYVCDVVLPACDALPGRYYIWADAPRGTEIYVERWDPVIPLIHTDIQYTATINAPSDHIEVPFSPAVQYYRFDYPDYVLPDDDDDHDHFYDKFFMRVRVSDVSHGSISVIFNTGHTPYDPSNTCDNTVDKPIFVNTESCLVATDGYDCYIDIQRTDIDFVEHRNFPPTPKTFWITIIGTEQQCELHSIQYSFTIQTQWVITYFNLDTTICESVDEDEYNFHRLRPHAAESPQQSYLSFSITDIDAVDGEEIELLIEDNYLPTLDTATFSYRSGRYGSTRDSTAPAGSIDVNWYCSYENLYFSTYGINSADGEIDYRLNVTKVYVDVKELFNNHVYHADDDDDDACPHEHDFYIFKAIAPNGGYRTSFLRVSVTSEGPTTVYINKGGFAWDECNVGTNYADRGTVDVYDFCTYEDTQYYITVVSSGPYYIYTNVIDSAVALTLGEVYRDSLEPGQYRIYTVEICKDYLNPDDRLTVEIADVQGSSVRGWIQKDNNPSPTTCQMRGPRSSALASYSLGGSGYDFILVNHCYLVPGTYHILIQALPHSSDDSDTDYDDDDSNLDDVSFRLFPRLKNYGVAIANLTLGVSLSDVVDNFYVDRNEPDSLKFTNYYKVTPLFTQGVYENGISFAQVRLANVNGGLLRIAVNKEKLASYQFGYIPGTITDLTKTGVLNGNIQSGHYPNTNQRILDREPIGQDKFSCRNGCNDLCASMDNLFTVPFTVYNTDKSIALFVPSCYWDISLPFYVVVESFYQYSEQIPVTYDLQVDQYVDFPLLQPNINQEASMTNDNWEYHFYRTIQPEVQSARWRVVVSGGEGVFLTVSNNRCPRQATWTQEIFCDAAYFDRPWMCEIQIPTAAAHPGNNAFFVSVYGKNATYSIVYWRGRENCHNLYGDGESEGLDFCAGLVPYTTWRWDDYSKLDNEAQCFFEELYEHFRVQPCWSGVTTDCNATLQRFACYESFRRCDEYGFYVGTCRKACNAVVYECVNWFESVNLEHYNCSSSRYIDEGAYTCTGSDEFETFVTNTKLFFPRDPKLILYEAENPYEENASSVITLSVSLVLALLALVL